MICKAGVTVMLLAMVLGTVQPAKAQTFLSVTDTTFPPIDSAFLEDYTSKLTARIFLLYQNASLLVNADNNKIVYHPNVNVRTGISGFWKWFGLGLSIDNPVYKSDKTKYGNTSAIDLRINAFGRFLAAEAFLQRFKGFYVGYPERSSKTRFLLPEMSTFSIGISAYGILNPGRFSIRAAFIQTERQKKSAGSLLIWPSLLYFKISSNDGIIPSEIIEKYYLTSIDQVTNGEFLSLGLSPGYAYTLVFLKDFYITGAIFPGVAAHFVSYTSMAGASSDFEFSFQLSGRFALGYNSDKWFIGGSVQTGFNEVPDRLSNVQFNYSVAQFRIWGGTRFDIFRKKKNSTFDH